MKKYVIEKRWYGLEYVTVKLPVSRASSKHGELVDAKTWEIAEKMVARAIITHSLPLRGIEVQYLRKTLGYPLRDFAAMLGISHTALAKWEKQPKRRLEPMNEVGVRTLMAQLLKLEMRGWFGELVGKDKAQKIEITAKAA